MKRAARQAGFTFVEILAALTFVGILLPTVVGALLLCSRISETAERSANAVQLGENQLNILLLGNAWQTGEARGDFGQDWPGYRWEMQQATWNSGGAQSSNALTALTMNVYFPVQGQERSISLTTLANPSQQTAQ